MHAPCAVRCPGKSSLGQQPPGELEDASTLASIIPLVRNQQFAVTSAAVCLEEKSRAEHREV